MTTPYFSGNAMYAKRRSGLPNMGGASGFNPSAMPETRSSGWTPGGVTRPQMEQSMKDLQGQLGSPTTGMPNTGTPGGPTPGGFPPMTGLPNTGNSGTTITAGFGAQEGNPASGSGGVPDWMRMGRPGAQFPPQTGLPNTGNPGGPMPGAPLGGPQTGMPQTGTPGAGPMAGGSNTFGPQNNLINQQFSANPSRRTLRSMGQTDQAKNAAANYQFQPFQAQGPLNDTQSRNAFTQAGQMTQGMQANPYQAVAGTDLSGARNYLATAGANLGPSSAASGLVGPGAMGSFGYQGDTTGVRAQTQAQLNNVLNTTPDRATLASNTMKRLIDDTNPQFEQDLRQVGQKAAALGRVGAGMTTNDLGTVAQRRNEQLVRRSQELADQAAGLSLQDQQDKLNAARGVTSDFAGMDTGAGSLNLGYQNAANAERGASFDRARALGNDTFGRAMDLSNAEAQFGQIGRNDALTERNAQRQATLDQNDVLGQRAAGLRSMGSDLYGLDSAAWDRGASERDKGLAYDQNMFNNRLGMFNNLAADEQRQYGNDLTAAQFNRGERDYQYGLSRDAQNDAINQRMMQENLLNSRFQRGQGLFNAGYLQNPSGVMGQQYGSYANDAQSSYGAMGDLLGQYAMRGASGYPTTTSTMPEFNIPMPQIKRTNTVPVGGF